jgi:hypothetical protein
MMGSSDRNCLVLQAACNDAADMRFRYIFTFHPTLVATFSFRSGEGLTQQARLSLLLDRGGDLVI